jgi:hypothetical protein
LIIAQRNRVAPRARSEHDVQDERGAGKRHTTLIPVRAAHDGSSWSELTTTRSGSVAFAGEMGPGVDKTGLTGAYDLTL